MQQDILSDIHRGMSLEGEVIFISILLSEQGAGDSSVRLLESLALFSMKMTQFIKNADVSEK